MCALCSAMESQERLFKAAALPPCELPPQGPAPIQPAGTVVWSNHREGRGLGLLVTHNEIKRANKTRTKSEDTGTSANFQQNVFRKEPLLYPMLLPQGSVAHAHVYTSRKKQISFSDNDTEGVLTQFAFKRSINSASMISRVIFSLFFLITTHL